MRINNYFRFENLEVWKDAREFASLVYKITAAFPKSEQFGLTNQIRRASVSVVLNIAEGSVKGSDADFKRFLKMSQGSLHETITGFYLAIDQKYLAQKEFDQVYDFALKVNAKLNAFSNVLAKERSAFSVQRSAN